MPDPQVPGEQAVAANGATISGLPALAVPIGAVDANGALATLEQAPARLIAFVAAPASSDHREAVGRMLGELARRVSDGPATVIVHDFTTEGLSVLRLPIEAARRLADGVAEAIWMLSLTLPAAFESDSYRVSRMALEEELVSGHDTAIDDLKRRANSANIGLLQTPHGYGVAPMHDGRLVSADVFKALPDSLKAEVEAKLLAFESELSMVLGDRAVLQQTYAQRRCELERETAGLAVRAALGGLLSSRVFNTEIAGYVDRLSADLVSNAALFLGDPAAPSLNRPRAPIEIACDPRLARYRVQVLHPATAPARLQRASGLDRVALMGEVSSLEAPCGLAASRVAAGALTRAGRGFVVVDAMELAADPGAWPLLRQAAKTGVAVPTQASPYANRLSGIELPVECRIVVTGTVAQYHAWCAKDPDVEPLVTLINVFEPASVGVRDSGVAAAA